MLQPPTALSALRRIIEATGTSLRYVRSQGSRERATASFASSSPQTRMSPHASAAVVVASRASARAATEPGTTSSSASSGKTSGAVVASTPVVRAAERPPLSRRTTFTPSAARPASVSTVAGSSEPSSTTTSSCGSSPRKDSSVAGSVSPSLKHGTTTATRCISGSVAASLVADDVLVDRGEVRADALGAVARVCPLGDLRPVPAAFERGVDRGSDAGRPSRLRKHAALRGHHLRDPAHRRPDDGSAGCKRLDERTRIAVVPARHDEQLGAPKTSGHLVLRSPAVERDDAVHSDTPRLLLERGAKDAVAVDLEANVVALANERERVQQVLPSLGGVEVAHADQRVR